MRSIPDKEIKWLDFNKHMLQRHGVHIFKVAIEDYDQQYRSYYEEILSQRDFEKAAQFRNECDAKRYLVSRFVIRNILANFIPVCADKIELRLSEFKKPYVNGIKFNLSHSGNYILIAVADIDIGIDIELVKPDINIDLLLDNCFDQKERLFINQQNNKALSFYQIWTRKEAILKATGEGLIDELNKLNCMDDLITRNGTIYKLQTALLDDIYPWSLAIRETTSHFFYWNYT